MLDPHKPLPIALFPVPSMNQCRVLAEQYELVDSLEFLFFLSSIVVWWVCLGCLHGPLRVHSYIFFFPSSFFLLVFILRLPMKGRYSLGHHSSLSPLPDRPPYSFCPPEDGHCAPFFVSCPTTSSVRPFSLGYPQTPEPDKHVFLPFLFRTRIPH